VGSANRRSTKRNSDAAYEAKMGELFHPRQTDFQYRLASRTGSLPCRSYCSRATSSETAQSREALPGPPSKPFGFPGPFEYTSPSLTKLLAQRQEPLWEGGGIPVSVEASAAAWPASFLRTPLPHLVALNAALTQCGSRTCRSRRATFSSAASASLPEGHDANGNCLSPWARAAVRRSVVD
jgi:hypothetical protein